ncbi:MAG: hypothetical protein SVR94_19605 [Pseudomonadota bacterium]|nr:hypothetical protein [Pseudomonadota bacterium]
MKSLSTKLLASICIIALATGCASVTDAGLAEQPADQNIEQVTPPAPDVDPVGSGVKADPIVDNPRDTQF